MLIFSDFKSAENVFHFFEEISKIPHGSGNTQKIADYLVDFAKVRGLCVMRDEADNILIKKKATAGYENKPTVILQGHTDMVLAKSADSNINFDTDPLELYRDGDFLRARGTTLGGDDGVAVAYALALLDSDDIPHPAIEALFTSNEEIGLLGAGAFDTSNLSGRTMINIDSDVEGIFTVGCAGGIRIDAKLPMRATKTLEKASKITVCGLNGGHSGIAIGKSRDNAIKILGEVLCALLESFDVLKVYSLAGGNADNAIPRRAECLINIAPCEKIDLILENIRAKHVANEPNLCISIKECENSLFFAHEDTKNIVSLITEEPNGVMAMSEDIKGLVETSLNLGIVESSSDSATLTFSIRSSKGQEKQKLISRVTKIAEDHGATTYSHGEYPAWEFRKDSHLRNVMCEVYRKMYGKDATVVTIHAGLECGIFSDKIPDLDCVSIGPNNRDIHTTEERLSLSSATRVWEFLKEVLKGI